MAKKETYLGLAISAVCFVSRVSEQQLVGNS